MFGSSRQQSPLLTNTPAKVSSLTMVSRRLTTPGGLRAEALGKDLTNWGSSAEKWPQRTALLSCWGCQGRLARCTSVLCSDKALLSYSSLITWTKLKLCLGNPWRNHFQFIILTFFQVISEGCAHFLSSLLCLWIILILGLVVPEIWPAALSNHRPPSFPWRNHCTTSFVK